MSSIHTARRQPGSPARLHAGSTTLHLPPDPLPTPPPPHPAASGDPGQRRPGCPPPPPSCATRSSRSARRSTRSSCSRGGPHRPSIDTAAPVRPCPHLPPHTQPQIRGAPSTQHRRQHGRQLVCGPAGDRTSRARRTRRVRRRRLLWRAGGAAAYGSPSRTGSLTHHFPAAWTHPCTELGCAYSASAGNGSSSSREARADEGRHRGRDRGSGRGRRRRLGGAAAVVRGLLVQQQLCCGNGEQSWRAHPQCAAGPRGSTHTRPSGRVKWAKAEQARGTAAWAVSG